MARKSYLKAWPARRLKYGPSGCSERNKPVNKNLWPKCDFDAAGRDLINKLIENRGNPQQWEVIAAEFLREAHHAGWTKHADIFANERDRPKREFQSAMDQIAKEIESNR